MHPNHLIRDARAGAGLTQRQLAIRAGTSQAAIAAYELGHKEPRLTILERILAAAGYELRTELAALATPISVPVAAAAHTSSDWDNRSAKQHGAVLRDLLLLADHLPQRPAGDLTFPPIKHLRAAS